MPCLKFDMGPIAENVIILLSQMKRLWKFKQLEHSAVVSMKSDTILRFYLDPKLLLKKILKCIVIYLFQCQIIKNGILFFHISCWFWSFQWSTSDWANSGVPIWASVLDGVESCVHTEKWLNIGEMILFYLNQIKFMSWFCSYFDGWLSKPSIVLNPK